MDDPWGSPWAIEDHDKAQKPPSPAKSLLGLGPPPRARLSASNSPRIAATSTPSPWAEDGNDGFGDWASPDSNDAAASGWGGSWADSSAEKSGKGERPPLLTPAAAKDTSFGRASPIAWPGSIAVPGFAGEAGIRHPSPSLDPWASEFSLNDPVGDKNPTPRLPSATDIPTLLPSQGMSDEEYEKASSWEGMPRTSGEENLRTDNDGSKSSAPSDGRLSEEKHSNFALAGTATPKMSIDVSGPEEDSVEEPPAEDNEPRSPASDKAVVEPAPADESGRSSSSIESDHERDLQDSPITSIDEDSRARMSISRQTSNKVRELVVKFDGISRKAADKSAAAIKSERSPRLAPLTVEADDKSDFGDFEVAASETKGSNATSPTRTPTPEPAENTPGPISPIAPSSASEPLSPTLTHEQPGAELRSPTLTHEHPGAEPRSPTLTHEHPGVEPRSPILTHEQLGAEPHSPTLTHEHPGAEPRSPILTHEQLVAKFGDIKFSLDLTDSQKLFDSEEVEAIATASGEDADVSDHIITDSFTEISERKVWYRVSRQGSARKHNAGNDDNYRLITWPTSTLHLETIKIVRRWMEEDSLTGRVTLGGISGKTNMFGWDSAAEPISLDAVFKKKDTGHSKSASLQEKPPHMPVLDSNHAGAMPTPLSRTDIADGSTKRPSSMILGPTTSFSWSTSPVANRTPFQPALDASKPTTKTPFSLPPINAPPQRPVLAPIKTLVAPDQHGDDNDDDDDWGEMVSSPQVTTSMKGSQNQGVSFTMDANRPSSEGLFTPTGINAASLGGISSPSTSTPTSMGFPVLDATPKAVPIDTTAPIMPNAVPPLVPTVTSNLDLGQMQQLIRALPDLSYMLR